MFANLSIYDQCCLAMTIFEHLCVSLASAKRVKV